MRVEDDNLTFISKEEIGDTVTVVSGMNLNYNMLVITRVFLKPKTSFEHKQIGVSQSTVEHTNIYTYENGEIEFKDTSNYIA